MPSSPTAERTGFQVFASDGYEDWRSLLAEEIFRRAAVPGASSSMTGRLVALFILVPLLETYLFLQIGDWIGPLPALLIIVATGFLGAWLTRTQGLSVIKRFRAALGQGRLPQQEVVEGLLILIAGILLLTPGFLTDAVGYALLVPPLRMRAGAALRHYLLERFQRVTGASSGPAVSPSSTGRRSSQGGPVIDAEILDK